MACIKISDLRPVGTELFSDSESYLAELSTDELRFTQGGSSVICGTVITATIAVTVVGASYAWGRWGRRRC